MQIDEFVELAKRRRDIHRFKPDPVPNEYIEKMLEAARFAMSGANGQPWEFIVVKNEETKNRIAEAMAEQGKLIAALEASRVKEMRHGAYGDAQDTPSGSELNMAPVFIVICADPRVAQASQLGRLCDRRWVIDENMATTTPQFAEDLLKPILGIPPIIRIFSIAAIGYLAYEPKLAYRRELHEIVHFEKYDMSKYRSHEQVQEFIRHLRQLSLRKHPRQ